MTRHCGEQLHGCYVRADAERNPREDRTPSRSGNYCLRRIGETTSYEQMEKRGSLVLVGREKRRKGRTSGRWEREEKNSGAVRNRRWKSGWKRAGSRQFFAGSRVSLVCNVCSRLLPKEWFAERPMASARANSRVPQPRHLCIIMLRPPRATPPAPTAQEKSACPLPTLSHPPPVLCFASLSLLSPLFAFLSSRPRTSPPPHPAPSSRFLLTLLSLHTYSTGRTIPVLLLETQKLNEQKFLSRPT